MDEFKLPDFFYEIFTASLPRLGPGEEDSTRRALRVVLDGWKRDNLRILDVGCGNGAQTIQLALNTQGDITALDNHAPFLEELRHRAERAGVSSRIRTVCKSMCELGEADGLFDLIWSEGALSLYNMSFEQGVAACRERLAPGGRLAVSDLAWFQADPPQECREFFNNVYPGIAGLEENLARMRQMGYKVLGHFNLPETAWRENYFKPLAAQIDSVRESFAADPDRKGFLESLEYEREVYRKYSSWYGYTFFMLQRE